MLPVESAVKNFTGLDGKPLDGGYIYFGQPNQNPVTAPVTVFWDAAGTQPAVQPLRTLNGYLVRSGTPATVFFDGAYSQLILDSKKRQVIYAPTSDQFSIATIVQNFISNLNSGAGADSVGFTQAGTGAVNRTLQAKGRELVSITDYGASVGAPDNATSIDRAITYMKSVGGDLLIPGQFRTSSEHLIDVAGGIVSVSGNGPAASRLIATGANTPLTITGASECAVRSVGFDKLVRDGSGGNGLKIINTAYALIDHVTAYGYLNGIKTEAVLTTLLSKVLTRFCDIGQYLGRGDASCPNAITMLNCSSSLNNRFGVRADEAASLLLLGGSVEGNGWGAAAVADGFHGGIYLSNCGTEGGVGATIMGVHMEQNQGKADIHIATTKNPGTAYNIQNNSIFPIDNTHFTDNTIYIENSVEVVLNLSGNSFKHIGTYTPSAARKYIKSEAPSLVTVNTGGDAKQFFSALQTPDIGAWGPNVYRGSMFSARGTVSIDGTPAAVIVGAPYNLGVATRTGVGEVTCTFAKPMASSDYQVMVNPLLGAKTDVVVVKTVNYFTVQFRDLGGALIDTGFDFMAAGGL